jgi:hypothetical protein
MTMLAPSYDLLARPAVNSADFRMAVGGRANSQGSCRSSGQLTRQMAEETAATSGGRAASTDEPTGTSAATSIVAAAQLRTYTTRSEQGASRCALSERCHGLHG